MLPRLYSDLDLECLRPIEQLLEEYTATGRKAYLGRMGTDNAYDGSIPNAWMVSTPGHPFWLLPLEAAEQDAPSAIDTKFIAGANALYQVTQKYARSYASSVGQSEIDERYTQSGWSHLYVPDGTPHSVQNLPFWNI